MKGILQYTTFVRYNMVFINFIDDGESIAEKCLNWFFKNLSHNCCFNDQNYHNLVTFKNAISCHWLECQTKENPAADYRYFTLQVHYTKILLTYT